MAKKKVNVRKDYSYAAKKSLPKYKPARIPRKMQFLILRGPGINADRILKENAEMKDLATQEQVKVKLLVAVQEEAFLNALRRVGNSRALPS